MVYVGGGGASNSGVVPKMAKHSTYGYLIAFAAAMGGLLFGYEIGVVSQVLEMPGFKLQFGEADYVQPNGKLHIIDSESIPALTTFTFLAGCFVGALIVSYMADALGRKKSILIGGVGFLVGGAIQTFSSSTSLYFTGRVVSGLGIGILSMCSPLYISEAAPSEIRGRMLTIQQLMITIGILIASIFNSIFIVAFGRTGQWETEWRASMAMQCLPALLLVIIMFFMPESPRWLGTRGRDNEALNTIARLRGEKPTDAGPIAEYKLITDAIAEDRIVGNGSWSELFVRGLRNRLFIAVTLQMFQQWTGINVILYYQNSLLQGMGIDPDAAAIPFTLANNFVNMIGTFPGMYLIERAGRRKLLLFGGISMSIAHLLVCIFVSLQKSTGHGGFAYLAVASVYMFILSFASSWGPVVWAYQSEIFPLRVRAKGTGAATMSNWGWNAVIALITPYISKAIEEKMYLIFTVTCALMASFTYFFVPETMGKSLEEMDDIFGAPETDSVEYGKKY